MFKFWKFQENRTTQVPVQGAELTLGEFVSNCNPKKVSTVILLLDGGLAYPNRVSLEE